MIDKLVRAIKSAGYLTELWASSYDEDSQKLLFDLCEENERLKKDLEETKRALLRAEAGARMAHADKVRCHKKHERCRAHIRSIEGAVQKAKAQANQERLNRER